MPQSIHDEVYWRGVRRTPRKPKPKKLTAAELEKRKEKKRRQNRESQARVRERLGADKVAEIRKEETERCYDMELIKSKIEIQPVTGCWIWLGAYYKCWDHPRPAIRQGHEGRAWADIAAWVVAKGRKLPRGCWLQRDCENLQCVNPDHGLMANAQLVRARRRLYELGQQKDGRRDDEQRSAADDRDERRRNASG
jgi:hypothetical protein